MNNQIEDLVAAAAADPGIEARIKLFRALRGNELYYPSTEKVIDGREVWSAPLRRLGDGSVALVTYTTKNNRNLPKEFVGAEWRDLLRLTFDEIKPDWLVIVNRDDKLVSVSRSHIPAIIDDLRVVDSTNLPQPDTADVDLEEAISNASSSNSGDWFESVLAGLRGQEIFVHLADHLSPEGRPVMRTSPVGDVDGWILAYTSRRRAGITYAGLQWEGAVAMIKNSMEIPGIRIVNNADDWILLGRDVI